MNKWLDDNWRTLSIILSILAVGLIHPVLRPITLYILPLGRGFDDIVAAGFILIAVLLSIFGKKKGEFNERFR